MGWCTQRAEGQEPFDILQADMWDKRLELGLSALEIKSVVEGSRVFVNGISEFRDKPGAVDPYEDYFGLTEEYDGELLNITEQSET